jgi:predicted ATP-dependent endonuclease of OLD family
VRLTTITVQKFRNFVEPQDAKIEEDVTCLVGKNESGKTTILQALHRLRPANGSDRQFNLTTEYPRWRLARDRKSDVNILKTKPIQAEFAVDDSDLAAMADLFGVTFPAATTVHAWRAYDNSYSVYLSCPREDIIRAAAEDVGVAGDDLDQLLAAADFEESHSVSKSAIKELKERGELLRAKAMTAFENALAQYDPLISGAMEKEQSDALWSLLPRFFYFSNYSILPGEMDLNSLAAKIKANAALNPGEGSVVALLAHAGEEPEDFMDADYDSRKAELQAASADLSQRVFDYWRQNDDLEVIFDTDNVMVEEVEGNQRPHRILKIELRDGRHGNVETNFSTRSNGFKWFFSFFAAFSEYQDTDDSIIVLLDEPGTSLHGEAQRDFVRFIFEELGTSKQVIYTTHSQHMVDPTRYEKLRAVHDKATRQNPDQGVIVTPIELSADRSTILPVESALGYSVSQHLFLGSGQHLTVEGSSDFVYLQRMTEYMFKDRDSRSQGLDPRLAILPVGSVDNMPAFVALLGRRLSVSALVDGDRTSKKLARVKAAAEHNNVDVSHIVVCSDVKGTPTNADIEDLFDVADYLRLYNWAFDTNLKVSDLAATDEPIIKRITSARGSFDHALPAHALTTHREEFFGSIKSKTVKQFSELFEKLNATVTNGNQ